MEESPNLYRAESTEIFHTLDASTSRTSAFGLSVGVHFALLATLLIVPLFITHKLEVRYETVLTAPPPEPRRVLEVTYWKQPEARPVLAPPAQKLPFVAEPLPLPPPQPASLPLPKPELVKREELQPMRVAEPALISVPIRTSVAAVAELRTEPAPPLPERPPVRTNVFANESTAKPTAELAARDVQTGGFGDPNGVRAKGTAGKAGNISSLGSFDLPVGSGAGNGTGGARGLRAVVAGSGFGGGVDAARVGTDAASEKTSDRSIRQAGFADTQAAAGSQPVRKQGTAPLDSPVEITFKPRPDYTEQARQSRLEGEVILRVLFSASGQARVLEVVRGLERGLDENAVRAAERIQFKPALRNKSAVDSTAVVHIVFQLAY
jgi:TonB family protein